MKYLTVTTYRRASANQSYGYIAKGDSAKVLGASGSYTQIKYPVSGGYKYAFIRTTDLNTYLLSGTASSGKILNGTYKLVSYSANTSTTGQKMAAYQLSQVGIGDYRGNNNVKYNT